MGKIFDRCVRKVKRKSPRVNAFAVCQAALGGKFFTSINDGHRHRWKPKNKFTTVNDGHKHKMNLKTRMTSINDGHKHRLLKKHNQPRLRRQRNLTI